MKRQLEQIEIPAEHVARERAWSLVQNAFAERAPSPRRRSWRPGAIAALAFAVVAAALSSPGRAVLDDVRDAVLPARVEQATQTVKLPAPGRLLVVSAEGGGVWVLHQDGSRRRIGDFTDASWSPYGRFVAATTPTRLLALEPSGRERWSLVRKRPSWPRWGGSETDTRIAYVTGSELRVVGGDGRGDRAVAQRVQAPPAWRPGPSHVLAFADTSGIRVVEVDSGRVLWRRQKAEPTNALLWSSDGSRLAVLSSSAVTIYRASGQLIRDHRIGSPQHPTAQLPVSASFVGATRDLAVVVRREGGARSSRVLLVPDQRSSSVRQLFAGAGILGDAASSPDGRWLLVDWRTADQWIFLRLPRVQRITAASAITAQFPRSDSAAPLLLLEGRWCCSR